MLMKSILTAFMLPMALGAQAETLSELRGRVSGAEVEIQGHIGTGLDLMDDEELAFRDSEGAAYKVVFDAGRDARKSLDGCEFALFGGGSPCALTAKAEVEWDGANLRLIIFEVVSISPPAPL
jgi:hypothetical protein